MNAGFVGSQYPRNFWRQVSFGRHRARFGDDGDGSVNLSFADSDPGANFSTPSQYGLGAGSVNANAFDASAGAGDLGITTGPTSAYSSDVSSGLGISADQSEISSEGKSISALNPSLDPNFAPSASSTGSDGGFLSSLASLLGAGAKALAPGGQQSGTQIKTGSSGGFLSSLGSLSGTSIALGVGAIGLVLFLSSRPKRVVVSEP